jgi:hypothetical protein
MSDGWAPEDGISCELDVCGSASPRCWVTMAARNFVMTENPSLKMTVLPELLTSGNSVNTKMFV